MDMQRLDPDQPGELERWAGQLGVPTAVLQQAVQRVGTDIDKLKGYLAAHQDDLPPTAAG